MRMSDIIAQRILQLIEESEENIAEIGRNELAAIVGCAPSQINYVLTSRFTPEQGFIIESRRGGGGYIRVSRIKLNRTSAIMHIINSIDVGLSQQEAEIIIKNLQGYNIIDAKTAKLLKVTTNDKVLGLPKEYRDNVRTRIFKNILINLI